MSEQNARERKLEIKKLILDTLGIADTDPGEVDDDKLLFSGDNKITLDSVDALEIIMAIQRKYQVRIADQNLARNVIRSVNSIYEFLESAGEGQSQPTPAEP
jgi:acyl carrier protein